MTEQIEKIAVAGATGRAGRHVVELLAAQGHEVVAISRSSGVDVVTGEGLAGALAGADAVIDVATGPSPDEAEATEFFTASASNLQRFGERAGVRRIVAVSIIGCDRFSAGYNAAKVVHEQVIRSGPIPATVLRAAQFHEFVDQLLDWCTQGDVGYLPKMRTQLVAARTVAEAAIELATSPDWALAPGRTGTALFEIAGPRAESLAAMAALLAERRGRPARVEEVSDAGDPDSELFAEGGLLPGPYARLAEPTFREWLDATIPASVPTTAAAGDAC